MASQIKSKKRVAEHGEVFTNEREVKAMCDLAKDETERIDSRVLEPACGDGNFLAEILNRKLNTVKLRYSKNKSDFEKYTIVAISSLYGVDILEDNAQECRDRLFKIWDTAYTENNKKECIDDCRNAAKYIITRNILCGDALTLLQNNGQPIIFSEWSLVAGVMLKRRDFELSHMLEMQDNGYQRDLFLSSDDYDTEIGAYIPKPIVEYKPIEYWRIQCQEA
ncbi:MAG: SAM-dependent DNA methyltransferase [Candidatus Cloacimonetes bacterium]|nr:SAM-dependent DNA methyltransferase [Candidatus Cloacimonadota bacterium]